jgi:hypothetical protein
MSNSNFSTVQTVLNQKLSLISLALAGLRDQSTHSEINPEEIESIELLVGETKQQLIEILN